MSGPTNRRFVRAAWRLLAFQFVAALGAVAMTIWAATSVQRLIDQRDTLQARVHELESRPAPIEVAPETPAEANEISPIEIPSAPPSGTTLQQPPPPIQPPPPRHGSSTPPPVVETPTVPPPVIVEHPPRPLPPDETPLPPTKPTGTDRPYRPPVIILPRLPRDPGTFPIRPTRPSGTTPNPGTTRPPVNGAGTRPTRPVGTIAGRPVQSQPQGTTPRPVGTIAVRPTRPVTTNAQPGTTVDPRRIRRPRPTDTQTEVPK